MTKYRFYKQGGEKGDLPPYLYTTTNYAISFLLYIPFNTLNLLPPSCRASLESIETPDFLTLTPQFARKGNASQSLITRNPKALFKGKSLRGLSNSGESKVLPRYMQNRFEGHKGFLHQASKKGINLQGDALKLVFVGVHAFSISDSIKGIRRISAI